LSQELASCFGDLIIFSRLIGAGVPVAAQKTLVFKPSKEGVNRIPFEGNTAFSEIFDQLIALGWLLALAKHHQVGHPSPKFDHKICIDLV